MKAAVINNDKIEIKEIDKPILKEKGAIIEVLGSGLCGSDIIKYLHKQNGIVMGHEIVGSIVEIDSDADFKKGDLIVMGHHVPCYECDFCKGGSYSMCKQFKSTNIKPGGFAQYIFASELHLKNTVHKIPKELTEIEASFMEPLGCCVRAIERAQLPQNSMVAVIGLGSIGILMGQGLKAYGHKVIGIDLIQERLNLADNFGFDNVIKYSDENTLKKEICNIKNIGVDAVFLTAGAKSSIETAKNCIRNGGTIVVFSSINDDKIGFSNNDIYYRELKVLSTYSATPETLSKSLNLLKKKKVKVDNLSVEYTLENLQKAINKLNKKLEDDGNPARLKPDNVWNSGRYYAMWQAEQSGIDVTKPGNRQIVEDIFRHSKGYYSAIHMYKAYKEAFGLD